MKLFKTDWCEFHLEIKSNLPSENEIKAKKKKWTKQKSVKYYYEIISWYLRISRPKN